MNTTTLNVDESTTQEDIERFLDENFLSDSMVVSIDLGLPIMAYLTRDGQERQTVVLRTGDIEKRFPRSVGDDRSEESITVQGQGSVDAIIIPFRERDAFTWKGCAYIDPNDTIARATFTIYPAKVKAAGVNLAEMIEAAHSAVKLKVLDRLLN